MRANYVASIFRNANRLILDLEDPSSNGWDERSRVVWSGICYPDDVCELLVNYEENEDRSDVVHSDFEEDSDDVMGEDED
eukprot:gene14386-biopygen11490